jgi:hypothetical protein
MNSTIYLTLGVQAITAIGLALTGLASAFNVYLTWRNGVRARIIATNVEVIKAQTDGINQTLVKVTGEAEHAKGLLQGRSEEGKI